MLKRDKRSWQAKVAASRPFMSEVLSNQRSLIVVGLLFVASMVPALSVEIPAMVDYVNPLARMHLLVDAAAGRPNPAYEIDWRLSPKAQVRWRRQTAGRQRSGFSG